MTLSRRAWVLGAAALAACGKGPVRSPEGGRAVDIPPDLDAILTRAALAPSRHNEQPWRVTLHGDDELVIRAKAALKLSVDRHGFAAPLALGAFTKNLRLAAAREGRRVETEVADGRIAVTLSKARPVDFPSALFSERVTPRDDFAHAELDTTATSALFQPSNGLYWISKSSPAGKRLTELTMEGARAQLARQDVRAELARWVHLDDEDAERLGDGYTLASLGITGASAFALRNFLGVKAFEDPRFTSKAVARTARHLEHMSGFVVLTVADKGFAALVGAGEALQDMALRLRPERLGMHPMVQAVEEGDPANVAAEVGLPGAAVFVARVGRTASPPPRQTFRRQPAAFVDAPDEDG